MKKIPSIYKKYMFRPILYNTVRNLVICAVLVLLWDRFLNPYGLPAAEHAGFCIGGVVFLFAWFEYLRLDGMTVHHLDEELPKKKKERHRSKQMIDFVDEKIVTFDELEEDEKCVCRLLSRLICGAILLLVGTVSAFL